MISFDSQHTSIPAISGEKAWKITKDLLSKREQLWFIDVDISTDVKEIKKYSKKLWNDFDSVVVLGIWWSALGTKALLESLQWKYYNEIKDKQWKNIYVLDNIDPETFSDIERLIDISRTLFIFISKSGGTIETLSEYIYFRDKCQKNLTDWKKHFCFIVGENCSMKHTSEEDFQVFYIPENIWGRFSVFTPVWLLPLAFSWADVSLFLEWISEMKESLLSADITKNISLGLAFTQQRYYNEWKNICVFFPYSSRLFQVWEWYKQLMWESIWKDGEGITLTSSLWVTDQHSQLQLYQDGPNDKFYITIDIQNTKNNIQISPGIGDFSFKKLLEIEKYGTVTSLQNAKRPICNISLWQLDEKHIASLLYILMFQVAYLWELMEINAFDQPGVEKSKVITKKKLREEIWDIDIFSKAFYD